MKLHFRVLEGNRTPASAKHTPGVAVIVHSTQKSAEPPVAHGHDEYENTSPAVDESTPDNGEYCQMPPSAGKV
jgi:hypothetical protein